MSSTFWCGPPPDSATEERAAVKKAARQLPGPLKELLGPDWRQKSSARLQIFTPKLYKQNCSTLFEHLYEKHMERNGGEILGLTMPERHWIWRKQDSPLIYSR